MGFVVEQGSKTVGNFKPVNGKPIALIYAKKNYMLEPVEVKKFIRVLTEYFEVHATIADATSALPKTIRNHGLLAGAAYMEILRSSKLQLSLHLCYVDHKHSAGEFLNAAFGA
ncbi:unnamed protein product [Dibothriocephalus latus]|uniref:alpha-1,6-mannosyl-glycoprotein 6-beta-N-acetylglucosaminyltransferase n=1 Tax=Dibothriocephalus latus TaxID=60516 RepID=A0A3P7P4W2_DIBLA|nr:unnamed protein product [Dibothriocephalus latus]